MAIDKRIDQLTAAVPSADDLIPIYDVSSPGTKKISIQQIASLIGSATSEQTLWHTITAESNMVTISTLINRTVKLLLIGGIGSGEVITSGTPTGAQILFDWNTGKFTKPIGNNFFVGEILTVKYI